MMLHYQKTLVQAVAITTALGICMPVAPAAGMNNNGASTPGNPTKEESVYVNIDPTGKIKDEIVSNWLHDDTAGAVIKDSTSLTDIHNVTGNEKPDISGNDITWKLNGTDLYYQGKTTKALPVEMVLHYYLNGKEVAPKNLGGSSGKFELKISFKNRDAHDVNIKGGTKKVYTPFICATAFNLPRKYFSNVHTNFGRVVSDGNNQVVSYVNVPGLKQSFDMLDNYINLPDELDVTADADNFNLGPIMMVATPAPDLDSLKNTDSLNNLTDKLNQLYEAGLKLHGATGTLNQGERAFADGIQQLFTGVCTAGTSFDRIIGGAEKLNNGIQSTAALSSGVNNLAGGIDGAYTGASQLLGQFQNGTPGKMTLKDSIDSLNSGSHQVAAGMTQLMDQFNDGSVSNPTLKYQINSLAAGTKDYVDNSKSVISALRGDSNVFQQVLTRLAANPNDTSLQTTLILLTDQSNSTQMQMVEDKLHVTAAFIAEQQAAYDGGGQAITEGTGNLANQMVAGGDPAHPSLYDSAVQLNTGIQQLAGGTQQLAGQMVTSGDPSHPSLYDVISQLNYGLKKLSDGGHTLSAGAAQLGALQSGMQQFTEALKQFQSGLSSLKSGTSTLVDKSNLLAGGTSALDEGMNQFWSEGLSKLQGADRDKLDEALQVKDALIDLSDNYRTFTGTGAGIESNVKFIVKTDEISGPATTAVSPSKSAPVAKSDNIFQRIGDWFRDLFHK